MRQPRDSSVPCARQPAAEPAASARRWPDRRTHDQVGLEDVHGPVVAACLAALGVAYLLFSVALGVSRRNREREGAAF